MVSGIFPQPQCLDGCRPPCYLTLSPFSVAAAEAKAAPKPTRPRLGILSPPNVTASSVRLSWTTLTTFDSFLIQYKVQGSEVMRDVTVPGGKRVYLIVGLLPSTKYTVYIYGISGTKRSQPLTTHITTPGTVVFSIADQY